MRKREEWIKYIVDMANEIEFLGYCVMLSNSIDDFKIKKEDVELRGKYFAIKDRLWYYNDGHFYSDKYHLGDEFELMSTLKISGMNGYLNISFVSPSCVKDGIPMNSVNRVLLNEMIKFFDVYSDEIYYEERDEIFVDHVTIYKEMYREIQELFKR